MDPEEVNEAIVTLIRSRAVEGAFNLDTNVRKLTFIQYKRALIDRLAIIALFPIPYQEEHFNYEWFKGDRILNKHFDVEITKENIAAKKVKDYTDKEAADLKKHVKRIQMAKMKLINIHQWFLMMND